MCSGPATRDLSECHTEYDGGLHGSNAPDVLVRTEPINFILIVRFWVISESGRLGTRLSSKFGNWKLRQRVRRSQCGGYPGRSPGRSRAIEPRCLHCYDDNISSLFQKCGWPVTKRCNLFNAIFSPKFNRKNLNYVAFSWENKIIHCENNFHCAKQKYPSRLS